MKAVKLDNLLVLSGPSSTIARAVVAWVADDDTETSLGEFVVDEQTSGSEQESIERREQRALGKLFRVVGNTLHVMGSGNGEHVDRIELIEDEIPTAISEPRSTECSCCGRLDPDPERTCLDDWDRKELPLAGTELEVLDHPHQPTPTTEDLL